MEMMTNFGLRAVTASKRASRTNKGTIGFSSILKFAWGRILVDPYAMLNGVRLIYHLKGECRIIGTFFVAGITRTSAHVTDIRSGTIVIDSKYFSARVNCDPFAICSISVVKKKRMVTIIWTISWR